MNISYLSACTARIDFNIAVPLMWYLMNKTEHMTFDFLGGRKILDSSMWNWFYFCIVTDFSAPPCNSELIPYHIAFHRKYFVFMMTVFKVTRCCRWRKKWHYSALLLRNLENDIFRGRWTHLIKTAFLNYIIYEQWLYKVGNYPFSFQKLSQKMQ